MKRNHSKFPQIYCTAHVADPLERARITVEKIIAKSPQTTVITFFIARPFVLC